MERSITPFIGRRTVTLGLSAAAASLIIPLSHGLAQSALVPTPRQTTGPFYPVDWSGDVDADLVRVRGEAASAMGEILHVQGRVLDVAGAPIGGASVEIWQCDAQGVYRHPQDETAERQRDAAFQGHGRATADAQGRYGFRTIRPVPYGSRTPTSTSR